jgi:hypothetical protein
VQGCVTNKGVLDMSGDNQPAFRVYSVIPREGKDDYWLNIGLAFPHNDGKSFNVMLQALPLNAKLVLCEAAEEEKQQPSTRQDRNDRRGEKHDYKPQDRAGRSGSR